MSMEVGDEKSVPLLFNILLKVLGKQNKKYKYLEGR